MDNNVIKNVIDFLQLFMPQTLAKRIISMVLIAAGIPNNQVTELTGYCDRSVRTVKKAIKSGETSGLFHVGGGGGRSKLADVETGIIEEISRNDYHSYQQIADMAYEKFKIKVSLYSVRRLLKKTASSA